MLPRVHTAMDVLRSNLIQVLPCIENAISKSLFIAIDTEFTGLSATHQDRPSLFDSVNDRYRKLRATAQQYMVCQFGLSAYLKDSDCQNGYIAHTFNFYLFPQDQGGYHPRFSVQASNMEFLCQHKFDFNKWIYEGIPYCNSHEENLVLPSSEKATKNDWIEAVGFRHIFKLLVESKKPIIGHNMLMDLVYIMEKFHEPLPASYEEFKRMTHSLFPVVIDTKNICFAIRKKLNNPQFLTKTSLEEIYETVSSKQFSHSTLFTPVIKHSNDSKKYIDSCECFHEAGFDAYCVGFVFVRLAHHVSMQGVRSNEAIPLHFNDYLRTLHPYLNKINLSRGPVRFINLSGKDGKCENREILVVMHSNGDTLIEREIKEHYFRECGPVDVQLVTKQQALITVPSKIKVDELLTHTPKDGSYTVRRYKWYKDTPLSQLTFNVIVPTLGTVLLILSVYLKYWKNY